MGKGKFELHKWCSNSEKFLEGIPLEKRELKFSVNEDCFVKSFGMVWHPIQDKFVFEFNRDIFAERDFTKRTVLSDIARFFDPLGIIEPVKIAAKMFMQKLWEKHYDWDSKLDEEDEAFWKDFRAGMEKLGSIAIDRFVLSQSPHKDFQIHGFSDASMNGYGAVVYSRCIDADGVVKITLLCSRSRVAPLNSKTIPKLELCAATLLANLFLLVRESIRRRSRSLKTFVSHRVSEIQELTNIDD